MKAKITIFVFFFLILSLLNIKQAHAAGDSAELTPNVTALETQGATREAQLTLKKKDYRVEVLKEYLQKWNSPLSQYAQVFIDQADLYNLPWNLVAAVAGTESTFGQEVPANCNNPFGFGIYTGHMTCFTSYEESIKTVSKSLREDYIDKFHLSSLEEIGHVYASSDAWPTHTRFFLVQMEASKLNYESQLVPTLPISL